MSDAVTMDLNYAEVPPDENDDGYYKIMYVMDPEEFKQRGGMKPGEFIDQVIVPGSVCRSPIQSIATPIHDARQLPSPASLAVQGFALVRHANAPTAYPFELGGKHDDAAYQAWLHSDLLPKAALAVSNAVRDSFGEVASVHAIDYTLRCTDGAGPSPSNPVLEAHCDFTPESGAKRVATEKVLFTHGDATPIKLEDAPLIINLWQPLVPVVYRKPLVMCDIRSAAADDYVKKRMIFRDREGQVFNMKFNEQQEWYFYPHQTIEECLVFVTWASDGKTTPHSGAVDKADPADSPARRSMETRWMVKLSKQLGETGRARSHL